MFVTKSLKALELCTNQEIFLAKGLSNYFSYATIAWTRTKKSNLISLYRHQKHVIRIIYNKDRFPYKNLSLNMQKH